MADQAKILAQSNPAATTLTDVYTVPVGVIHTVLSTIVVANRSTITTFYRISVALGGAADNLKQYIAYDSELPGADSRTWTIGITLAVGDVVRVYATDATVSFNIFGVEVS